MRRKGILFISFIICFVVQAQYPLQKIEQTSDEARHKTVANRIELKKQSRYTGINGLNIGPTVMSGRVVDLKVDPKNTKHFYVAYATGGVWETKNNGQSFDPIFDNNAYTNNCGALAVDWENRIIYVGTGEANSSRSSYAGMGLFSNHLDSTDTPWEYLGLSKTHHIARILIYPKNANTLFVAGVGSLFSPNKERGIYKSTDQGKNWKKVLFVDENTGAIDLEINPNNPAQLMASMWEKARRSWNFWESGINSGIYISADNGETWNKSKELYKDEATGRIGITVANDGTCYAILDNQTRYKEEAKKTKSFEKDTFLNMSVKQFISLDDSLLNAFLKKNNFESIYTSKKIKKGVKRGIIKPSDLHAYLSDANADLFNDPVTGAEVYRSNDFGKTWNKTHSEILSRMYFTYGYYFGVIEVNPTNSNQVYVAGVPLYKSSDAGKDFRSVAGANVHVDHHVIWINPNDSNHLINGNDGGINITYDGGKNWVKCNSPSVGQFYTVAVDNEKTYNVYGGLQDNGVWKGPNSYSFSNRWHQEGKYPYTRLMGGDGMQIQINNETKDVYTGYQFGHYFRITDKGKFAKIHPKHKLQEEKLRWNWQTPILLSPHDNKVLYMGSNRLYKINQDGQKAKAISPDLTGGARKGDVSYGTLTCISESPVEKGVIYTGSDDGIVSVTKNGGKTWYWEEVTSNLPKGFWITDLIASRHTAGVVYIVLNGHTFDHFESMIYKSDNYGETVSRICTGLPGDNVNSLIEDHTKAHYLYIGTDAGLYLTTDGGLTVSTLSNLPFVPIHDLAIQENHRDLIAGTHGRGIYKIQMEPIYQMDGVADTSFLLHKNPGLKFNDNWGTRNYGWNIMSPVLSITGILPEADSVEIDISTGTGDVLMTTKKEVVKGYNSMFLKLDLIESPETWKGKSGDFYPNKGTYYIVMKTKSKVRTIAFEVK